MQVDPVGNCNLSLQMSSEAFGMIGKFRHFGYFFGDFIYLYFYRQSFDPLVQFKFC